jgi:hypothetical protein
LAQLLWQLCYSTGIGVAVVCHRNYLPSAVR